MTGPGHQFVGAEALQRKGTKRLGTRFEAGNIWQLGTILKQHARGEKGDFFIVDVMQPHSE